MRLLRRILNGLDKLTIDVGMRKNTIEQTSYFLLWIISYNEMLEIKIGEGILPSKINMLKSCVVDNIHQSDDIIYGNKQNITFDMVHKHYSSYDVSEKNEIMSIKNGKFIIWVANMFNCIVGKKSRFKLKDIKTKDYNEFIEDEEEGEEEDFYFHDAYSNINYYDEVSRFYIEKYTKEYKKINHFF